MRNAIEGQNSQQGFGQKVSTTVSEDHFKNNGIDFRQQSTGQTIVSGFEEQVLKSPNNAAICEKNSILNYSELNSLCNGLAQKIFELHLGSEGNIALLLENGRQAIVGMLGVLKSGNAYVPLDLNYPLERLKYIIKDTNCKLIIASLGTSHLAMELYHSMGEGFVINIDLDITPSLDNLKMAASPAGMAYILYTSGSTGEPKGVVQTHKNVLHFTRVWTKNLRITDKDRISLLSSYTFDSSVQDIYGALLNGASLYPYELMQTDQTPIAEWVIENEISIIHTVPTVYRYFISTLRSKAFPHLRLIALGGEATYKKDFEDFKRHFAEGTVFLNGYGATESSINLQNLLDHKSKVDKQIIPLGYAVEATKIYLLKENDEEAAPGEKGELVYKSDYLAIGYWNKQEQTENVFTIDPITKTGRVYRSGDLGTMLASGEIEFAGRKDNQVKIRGQRVELAEIEKNIINIPRVNGVAAAVKNLNGEDRIVAYIQSQQKLNVTDIRRDLQQSLPSYMLPDFYEFLEKFPLTRTGKISRRALPDPDINKAVNQQYIAPVTPIEVRLVVLWQSLLGIKEVGTQDNFFELGGHSLLAIRAVSAIRKELQVEITVKDLFSFSTLSQLAAHLATKQTGLLLPAVEAVHPRPTLIPLSYSQEWWWFVDQLESSVQYHIPMVLRFRGKLNKEALSYALLAIVNRHEVLHTVIIEEDGVGYQYVKDQTDWHLRFIDGSKYQDDPGELQNYIRELIKEPFDLSKDDMLRATLISLTDEEQVLVLTMHHIALDGWSLSILAKELGALYGSFSINDISPLDPLAIQYADYALWQRRYLQGELLEKKINYWRNKLQAITPLQLPTDYPRLVVQSTRGALKRFNIDNSVVASLQTLSNEQSTTLYMTVLAAFKVLLYRYSGQEDLCIGGVIAGRQQHEIEDLIGCFINMLALRTEVKGEATFIELLQQVKATTLEAYEHQEAPIEKVVEAVAKQRDQKHPLYQVMFIWHNIEEVPEIILGNVNTLSEGNNYDNNINIAQFDITFTLTNTRHGLEGEILYSPDLYKSETIERMKEHFMQLLSSVIKEPFQKVGKLHMLTFFEEQQALTEFNDTAVPYASDKTVIELFEAQAAITPDGIAVVFEEEQLTYQQLNKRANQLAYLLKSKGVKENTLVPLCLERSQQMIVGILGILKAGGAYVPIDPKYPVDRIKYMVADSQAAVVVGSSETKSILKTETPFDIIELESKWSAIDNQPVSNLDTNPQANHLAYMIYTSGSTGRPKGAAVKHQNISNLLQWYIKEFAVTNLDKNVIISSFAFDLTQKNIFSTLITGGTLILPAMRYYDNECVVKHICQQAVTIINCAPNAFYPLVTDNRTLSDLNSLRLVVLGGEPIQMKHLEKWILRDDYHCEIVNSYGPTECTDIAAIFRMKHPKDYINKIIPIGRANDNVKLFVLNESDQLQPVGVVGEICITGDGVGVGYLNDKGLTARKFIANPFSSDGESKLYKTGDLGRWLSDGNIEYLGRKDNQVKIRGYRIELGEIETALQHYNEISEGVVLASEDRNGSKRLIGYVVPKGKLNREAIKSYLQAKLPEHMIPAIWIELEKLPLTPNGKIDRKSLPDFDSTQNSWEEYIAPRNETEKMIAKIWEEVLEVEKVGMDSNFFELGGQSLAILKLASKIRKLGLQIEIKDFFKYQTIEQQSEFLKTSIKLLSTAGQGQFVIPIQPGGKNPPLFAFPEFLLYSKIGRLISKQQPFYSIEQSPHKTTNEVVDHYIREIKKIYPTGPYNLAGYCKWGNIAVEMAQTLVEQGDEVPVIVLIEYYNPLIKTSRISKNFLTNKLDFIIKRLKDNSSIKEKGKFLADEFSHAMQHLDSKLRKRSLEISFAERKKYAGKVILFQSSETYGFKDDTHMGWKELFSGEVKKYIIKGEHLELMVDPNSTAQIAGILNLELQPISSAPK